jgi:cytoskeletal protein CcmA (bactofilin family)
MANIGKSIVIKGDLSGNEDLVIEGKVEGKVDLPNNRLTIGAGGQVQAQVHAKTVVVIGRVAGNVSAGERLEIQATGIVEGDVEAPRLVVAEGAVLNGSVKMSAKGATAQPRPAPSTGTSTSTSATPLPATASSQGEPARLI